MVGWFHNENRAKEYIDYENTISFSRHWMLQQKWYIFDPL